MSASATQRVRSGNKRSQIVLAHCGTRGVGGGNRPERRQYLDITWSASDFVGLHSGLPRLTGIQRSESNDRQGASNRSKGRQCSWGTEDTHRKVDLDEQDSGLLPADSPELHAVDIGLEDLIRLPDLGIDGCRPVSVGERELVLFKKIRLASRRRIDLGSHSSESTSGAGLIARVARIATCLDTDIYTYAQQLWPISHISLVQYTSHRDNMDTTRGGRFGTRS
jgi:hypothetical protein